MSHDSYNDVDGEDLADLLAAQSIESCFDKKDFWPKGCIDTIVSRDAVSDKLEIRRRHHPNQLGPAGHSNLDGLVNFIMGGSKTVFAILLCCGSESSIILQAMVHFQKLDFKDSKLPITGDVTKSHWFVSSTRKGYAKPWNIFSIQNFCRKQWRFLAPVFHNGPSDLSLDSRAILPFTWARQCESSGTFGEVFEVAIHSAHREDNIRVRPLYILLSVMHLANANIM